MIRILHYKTPDKYYPLTDFQIMGSKCQFFITVIKREINLIYLCLQCRACGILVPQLGIRPVPPAEAESPNHWRARGFPEVLFFKIAA